MYALALSAQILQQVHYALFKKKTWPDKERSFCRMLLRSCANSPMVDGFARSITPSLEELAISNLRRATSLIRLIIFSLSVPVSTHKNLSGFEASPPSSLKQLRRTGLKCLTMLKHILSHVGHSSGNTALVDIFSSSIPPLESAIANLLNPRMFAFSKD